MNYKWIFVLVIIASTIGAASHANEICKNDGLTIRQVQYSSGVHFVLDTKQTMMATVTFNCSSLDNMSPTHSLPFAFIIDRSCLGYEFLDLKAIDTTKHWSFGQWQYHFEIGIPSAIPTSDYVYQLPYSSSQHFRVCQSYLGTFSHFAGSGDEYAIDFEMPEGTTVLAARPGKVVAYRDDSNVHGTTKDFAFCANYVVVQHDDGTYALYNHLKNGGVMVGLNQLVSVGQPLALSGFTGWAQSPHLHFKVYRVKADAQVQSLPFRMNTAKGVSGQLLQNSVY